MAAFMAVHEETARQMVVDLPAAVGDFIVESRAAFDVVLRQRVVADVAERFAFSGQEADPFQFPIFSAVIAMVLHVVPAAEGDLK